MKLTTALLIVLLGSKNVPPSCQSSGAAMADSKDLGALADGKYSNDVLGIRLDLPSGWEIDRPGDHPEPRGELLIRLSAQLDRMIVSGTRLDPDEQLSETFHWSLRGGADGGGFKTVGAQVHETRDGHELLSQKLKRTDQSGQVTAVYVGFFNRGYYTSILLLGPAKTEESRAEILKSLTLLASPSS
jgi:hypothetical protein